jgi:uncharacterized protein (DUF2141 family)
MQSFGPFNYLVSVTGDCSHTSAGAISISVLGGTPPYTVDWYEPSLPPADVIIANTSVRTNLPHGTYSLRLNDSSLPTNNQFYVNIPVSSGVCCSVIGVQSTTCGLDNGAVTGTSTSLYSSTEFSIYTENNTFVSSATTNLATSTFTNLSAGTYYLVALDLGGCTGRSQNFIIEDSTPLDFGLYTVPNSTCTNLPNGKIFVTGQTGTPPFTYLWSNGETTQSITALTEGNYSVQVTDFYGCVTSKSTTVNKVPPIGFGIFTATQPTCFSSNGVINMTVTGGTAPFYYSASTGNVLISYSRTYSLSGLSSGSYSFLVTDAGLCSFVAGTTIQSPLGIASVTVNGQNSTCSSDNGSILVSVVGGVTPYTYTLIFPDASQLNVSNSQTSQLFSNLSAGTYTAVVQDNSGCSYLQEVIIITENKFTITTQAVATTCGQNNGQINITSTAGATKPIDYSVDGIYNIIDSTFSSVTINNLTSGSHVVTVTDADGCVKTQNVFIPSSQPLDYSLYSTSCGSGNNGKLTSFISSGVPPFQFQWSNNVSGNPQQIQVMGLSAGTYSLTIIDDNGCTQKRTTTITCNTNYAAYETYVMGADTFIIQSPVKYGLLQMMNEGFADLTSDNTSCDLVSAVFTAKVSVAPAGYTTSSSFYTSTSLNNAPSDNLYYNTVKNLLLSVPGVAEVIINQLNNQITIVTNTDNNSLNTQEIKIELLIVYDIMCLN